MHQPKSPRGADAGVLSLGAALALLLVAVSASFAQNPKDPLDKIVSTERQKVLGLDKLSAEQRAGIAKLLRRAYEQGLARGRDSATNNAIRGFASGMSPNRSVVETQIDGDFNGWEGETVVKLINGEIWQQTEYHYEYLYAFMPDVLIYPSGGGFKMKVEGADEAVVVQRLK